MTTEISVRDRLRNKPKSGVGRLLEIVRKAPKFPSIVILSFILLAIFADLVTTISPYDQNIPNRLQAPDFFGVREHWIGTDALGRDVLTRLIYGARVTLTVALAAISLGQAIGLTLGITSGFFGGWYDKVVMRVVDGFMSIPGIFLALLLAVVLGPSFQTVIIAIGLVIWATFVRTLRAETMKIKEADFVKLARVAGCSNWWIISRHIFPNLLNLWVVLVSLQVGSVILIEASLGFLGAGVPPPTPSWGSLISDGRQYVTSAWWLSFFPGLAIMLVVLSVNLFGDWLRDVLDPQMRQRAT
ncbi:MAG: ABC transporter permease [Dehalococcoidia bacterium]|nr:ABC transporter permease [Dehalococcoidia bacterium]